MHDTTLQAAAESAVPLNKKVWPKESKLLLAYNEWLDRERYELMKEMYKDFDPRDMMHMVPHSALINNFFWRPFKRYGDIPAPSTRAGLVLSAVGIGPLPDMNDYR